MGQANLEEAIVESDRVLTFEPENEYAYLERGWSYNGLGEYQKAITIWIRP
jgi:regulator of sirC expression with transglutaminase-like and TPR domain